MKYVMMIVLMQVLSQTAFASDDWMCTSQSSERRGNAILACGIDTARDETAARAGAFKAAIEEFHRVCDNSEDCKDHEFQVMPERTECEASGSGERCVRLLTVYIGHNFTPKHRARVLVAEAKAEAKRQVAELKLKIGMKKSKVLALFGRPYSVDHLPELTFVYDNICQARNMCSVEFEGDRVSYLSHVDPTYLDL